MHCCCVVDLKRCNTITRNPAVLPSFHNFHHKHSAETDIPMAAFEDTLLIMQVPNYFVQNSMKRLKCKRNEEDKHMFNSSKIHFAREKR